MKIDAEARQVARYLKCYPEEVLAILLEEQTEETLNLIIKKAQQAKDALWILKNPKTCHFGSKRPNYHYGFSCGPELVAAELIGELRQQRFDRYSFDYGYNYWISFNPNEVTCKNCRRTKDFKEKLARLKKIKDTKYQKEITSIAANITFESKTIEEPK